MPEQSPTEGIEPTPGAVSALPEESSSTPSADEHGSTVEGEQSQGNKSSESAGSPSTDDEGSSDDDGLARFAKSQGIDDLSELSDREKRLLKVAQDNQKAARNKGSEDLTKAAQNAYEPTEEELDDDPALVEARQARAETAQLRAENRIEKFFKVTPGAEELRDEMADILKRTVEESGVEAARYLAGDIKKLYAIARFEAGGDDRALEAARKAEREDLRRRQEAGAGGNPAASNSRPKSTKIDRNWVTGTYDPSNPEHRELLDEALSRGDLY